MQQGYFEFTTDEASLCHKLAGWVYKYQISNFDMNIIETRQGKPS